MTDQNHNRSPDRKSQKERIREITEQLEAGVQAVFESENYREYLKCMSKFHNYSVNNCLLIALQRPDASLVAGYQAWKKDHGRQVKKGEKGIKILAPCKYKVESKEMDENGDPKLMELTGFRVVTVFDYTQTEGKELPTIGVHELTGDVNGYQKLFNALVRICPVPIGFESIESGAKGYYSDAEKRVAIQSGMSQIQTIKTLIHEMAHAKLHAKEAGDPEHPIDRKTKEVEAESTAFCVTSALGIDTSDYSFGYVAGWSSGRDTKELKSSLERIRSAADGCTEHPVRKNGHPLLRQRREGSPRRARRHPVQRGPHPSEGAGACRTVSRQQRNGEMNMSGKRMIALDEYEQRILIRALNDLRTQLIEEERPTDAVDELILKVYESRPRHIMVADHSVCHEYR